MNKSKYYSPSDPVSVVKLDDYTDEGARAALEELLAPLCVLDKIKPAMTVVIKANLVSAMRPEQAATTHPTLIKALASMLEERGAHVLVGDSPGGVYNAPFVKAVYKKSGMSALADEGLELNMDFGQKAASFDEAKVLHTFTYTSYLDRADLIINFCKLKSHGMMGMSCAAKNMFGAIPGVIKPEYHYRFPKYDDFANMIIDLDEYFHPVLSIADAVVGMEGNGPTAGTPKKMGFLLASASPHTLDLLASWLIGLEPKDVPTLSMAIERGLIPDSQDKLNIIGEAEKLRVDDFEYVVEHRSLGFTGDGKNPIKKLFGTVARAVLKTKPVLKKDMCVGCGICRDICPAKAIVIEGGKAKIDRSACIRCFCCQEFCPKSAMKVQRTFIASLFHSEKKK